MDVFLSIRAARCAGHERWNFGRLKTALAEAFSFSCGRGKISMRMEVPADAHCADAACARSVCRMRKEILLRADAAASTHEYNKSNIKYKLLIT
jgi:hypothetical protein